MQSTKEMKIDLEIGKYYVLGNRKVAKIVYKSPIRQDPFLAVVLTDGYEEDAAIWYDEKGRAILDDYTIVAKIAGVPRR